MNLTSADAALQRQAHTEMRRRDLSGELSNSQRVALVHEALKFQADANRPWDPQWDQYIVNAQKNGGLSSDDWHRFIAAAKWTLEPINSPFLSRSNEPYNCLQIDVRYPAKRGLVTGQLELINSMISLDGQPLPLVKVAPRNLGSGSVSLCADPTAVLTDFVDGPHQGLLSATARLHLPDGTTQESALRTAFTVTLSGATNDKGTFVHDPAASAAIRTAIGLTLKATSRSAGSTVVQPMLSVNAAALPHNVAFRVFAMVDGEPKPIGRFCCKMNQPPDVIEGMTPLSVPSDRRSLVLELQPDGPIAEPLKAEPIWDGGIVLNDVPIAE